MAREVKIIIHVSEGFNLERAVCNHGFFMMAPNNWIPTTKTLVRPLRLANHDQTSVTASIRQLSNHNYLIVTLLLTSEMDELWHEDRNFIRSQVVRMLHISSEDDKILEEFHKLHPEAKEIGFGRIFRSPDIFEDCVKSILLCYTSWPRTLEMAEALCNLQHKLFCCKIGMKKKRKRRDCDRNCKGNFPSSKEIASLDEKTLSHECRLGLRASSIIELAKNIENGKLKFEDFVDRNKLMKIKGFGSFVAGNVLMCVGIYQYIPVDTETIKHLEQVHGVTNLKGKKAQMDGIAKIYDKFAPFQCLAYWKERVEFFEKQLGKLSELPNSKYRHVTSTNIENSN